MKLFDVYSLYDIALVKAEGCHVWDLQGEKSISICMAVMP